MSADTVSSLAHARQTLRMLQDVSNGTREKFEIRGCQPKPSKASSTKVTKPKTNGIAKTKREKSTKARDNRPSQHFTNLAMSSSSPPAQDYATNAATSSSSPPAQNDDATNAMDDLLADIDFDAVHGPDDEYEHHRA